MVTFSISPIVTQCAQIIMQGKPNYIDYQQVKLILENVRK